MKKLEHINIFRHAADQSEVYEAFQRDFNRDTYLQEYWHVILLAMAGGAVFISGHKDWLWLFGGLIAVERAIVKFIDNSNRNWAMHVIDWIEYNRHEDKGNAAAGSYDETEWWKGLYEDHHSNS